MKRLAVVVVVILASTTAWAEKKYRPAHPENRVAGRFIVVLNDDLEQSEDPTDDLVKKHGGKVAKRWTYGRKSFLLEANEAAAQAMSADPRVRFVEQDAKVMVSSATASWALDRNGRPHVAEVGRRLE